MSSPQKINVQILPRNNFSTYLPDTSKQPEETTINIRTTQSWVVTGKYRNNILYSISLNKLDRQESEA